MKTLRIPLLLVLALALYSGCATAPTVNNSLAALQARLNAGVNEARFAQAHWGIKVIALASGKTVFEHNADELAKPASNAKMYTASLALDRLGPDYRIKTSIYAGAKPDAEGTIHGDVIVYGRGDPSFASRFNDGDYGKSLEPVLDALARAGIKRIEGDLVGDDSYFHGAPYGSEWTWDDLQTYYGAPVSALMVEDNCLDLVFKPGPAVGDPCRIVTLPESSIIKFVNRTKTTAAKTKPNIDLYRPVGESTAYVWGGVPLGSKGESDSVSVPNPPLWFVTLLKQKLAERGVAVTGGVRSMGWLEREVNPLDPMKWVEVASVESRPLAEIVKNTLKPSQNQYAQLLLLQVGANTPRGRDPKTRSTEDDGLAEMRRFLGEVGIARGLTLLQEGSGLSRGALVTPSASVKLLAFMATHRYHEAFFNALPIAGVDGTLRNRFKGTFVAGNLRAKTGSLGYVDTLSGYMTTRGGDKLVLSFMLNNYSRGDGRAQIDALVKMLADYSGKMP